MKTDVKVVRGTTNTFRITVTDAAGKLYDLQSGEKLLFGVKRHHEDTEYIFVKSITSGENGVYTVTIDPSDTEQCDCCNYFYDVSVQSGNNFYNVIPTSAFCVCKNITKRGCA